MVPLAEVEAPAVDPGSEPAEQTQDDAPGPSRIDDVFRLRDHLLSRGDDQFLGGDVGHGAGYGLYVSTANPAFSHAWMPPATLKTLAYPSLRRMSEPVRLRLPLLQIT